MKPKYSDILSRISCAPLWHDSNGAPRFDPFRPELCSNFYADEILILKIQCQECHESFFVEIHSSKSSSSQSLEYKIIHRKKYFSNPIHYGDPPRHNDCIGETMNAESLQIVEFWKRESYNWVRKSKYEVSFEIEPFREKDEEIQKSNLNKRTREIKPKNYLDEKNNAKKSVKPSSKIKLYLNNNFNNLFLIRDDILAKLHKMSSSLPLREKNRVPRFASADGHFRVFGSVEFNEDPLLDVEVTSSDPELLKLLHPGSKIRKSDLMKPEIWAKSLNYFPIGATQKSSVGISYKLSKDMTKDQRILFFKYRNLKPERKTTTHQFIKGKLIIPDHSVIKILHQPYDPKSSPKFESDYIKKKNYSLITGVLIHLKIAEKIKILYNSFNAHIEISKLYKRLINALNHIYKYNHNLATHLSSLILKKELLVIEESGNHWKVFSDKFIKKQYPSAKSIFAYKSNPKLKSKLQILLQKSQKISGYGIYMSSDLVNKTELPIGDQYIRWFSKIMDAVIHANIPETFENNSIFMPYLRIASLFDTEDKTIISVQENSLLETVLKDMINAQGFSTFKENLESFMNLILDKTIKENSLWEKGKKDGHIWSRLGESQISPFVELRKNYLAGDTTVLNWNFIDDIPEAKLFIGVLGGNLHISFQQLGLRGEESQWRGDSEPELYHQIQFQYYKVAKAGKKLVQIKPGEFIKNSAKKIIGTPRLLMLKNQFVFDLLASNETFNVDTVVYFNDLHLDGSPFKDRGKNFIYGFHGTKNSMNEEYSDTKIRKIKISQDQGAFFVSGIGESTVYKEFTKSIEDIRTNPENPFYDPNFTTIYLMADVFDKLIYVVNNPAHYILGFEDIIDDLTRKVYGKELWKDFEDLSLKNCVEIVNAFGKYIDVDGKLKIRDDWIQLWKNFRNSNLNSSKWYSEQLRILISRLQLIKKFYNQIDPTYVPLWTQPGTLEFNIWKEKKKD